jgi:KipI family sensor histidine kinase inhibitor
MNLRLLPYGPAAVLIEVDEPAAAAAVCEWIAAGPITAVRAVVPAARTVLVEADPEHLAAVVDHLGRMGGHEPAAGRPGRSAATDAVLDVPVVYDGEDVDAVASECGMSVGELVRRHCAPVYTAAFCGFSPGFAYLIGGDPRLRLPRRDEPRTRVPAGSVAVAGEYSAVYPSASPGGWHLLGHTALAVWDVDRDPPALISPGTRLRFRPARTSRWP